jgi:hypothetical protein
MKDKDKYKLIDKKKVAGKIRNIYQKINDNFQEYYYKSNNKYNLGFTFHKKGYTIYKIKNIDDYNNKVVQQENKDTQKEYRKELKAIKKMLSNNSVVYLYKPKNKSLSNAKIIINYKMGGVGKFSQDVKKDRDIVAHRGFSDPLSLKDINKNTEILDYNAMYDNIIIEISNIGYQSDIFETINNLIYIFTVDGIQYNIRSHIEFNNNDNKLFLIYFYINTIEFNNSHNKLRYIKMPIHISLFLKDMLKKDSIPFGIPLSEVKIRCVTTGHIHITSSNNIKNFDIIPIGLKHTEKDVNTGIEKDISTHTYLLAPSIKDVTEIMKEHGKKIFSDWKYIHHDSNNNKIFNLFYPDKVSAKWKICKPDRGDQSQIKLNTLHKNNIFYCFNNLYKLIHNIFYVLSNNIKDINTIKANLSRDINVEITDNSNYLVYTKPRLQTKKNIEYKDSLYQTRRSLKITENDLKDADIYRNGCPGKKVISRLTPPPPTYRDIAPIPRRRTPSPPTYRAPVPRRRTPSPPIYRAHIPRRRTPSPPTYRAPIPRRRTPSPPTYRAPIPRRRTPSSPTYRAPIPRRRTPSPPTYRSHPLYHRTHSVHTHYTQPEYREISPRSRTPPEYRDYRFHPSDRR